MTAGESYSDGHGGYYVNNGADWEHVDDWRELDERKRELASTDALLAFCNSLYQ